MKNTITIVFTAGLLLATLASAAPADTKLIDAVKAHDSAGARALIGQGVDVNAADGDGSTALHWAASNGDAALTDALLKAGART
jgi:ankyrin repeat protein